MSRVLSALSRRGFFLSVCLWLGIASALVIAQPDDGDGAADNGEPPAPQDEVPVTDQPGGIRAAGETADDGDGNSSDADEPEEGAGRFIPSEQISQDLGVSFPADI